MKIKIRKHLLFFLIVNTNESSNVLPSLEVFSKRIFAYQKKLNEDRLITHLNSEPLLRLIDLLFWLKEWDKKTLSAWKFIFYDLFKGEEVWPYTELFCCLVIDNIPLAFCLNFPEKLDLFASYKSISGEINKLRNLNYLSNLSSIKLLPQIGVVPVVSQNLTTKFVFNRNLEGMKQENLTARTIVVIGVGAIGGYLTHSLARLGAGAEHGELILIDTDDLSESNIGRHILGQNYIKKSKVMALKEQLEIELPQLNIKVFNQGVETLLGYRSNDFDLSQADIIFDATAKAGIGEILSEWRRDLAFPQPCMIHVWIRDNGECVQALLNTPSKELKPQFACRSCLQIAGGKFLPQYDALPGHEPKIAYAACSDFTPYAVSASMSAAALATDMVLDYVNDENSPRYRTRYTERWSGAKLASTDATVALDCPCCFGI
ncbi:MAG: ThiF family adenylyltransferase [Acinetobacter venetianus]|uniref:ThiF family adenylyltransferase n=1 Tax=Acinetobacter venetianus TaxID=52133 RepID=UPI003C7639A4